MKLDGIDSIPDGLVNRALAHYQRSDSASIEEKMALYQYKYAQRHGPFHVDVHEESDMLDCTLHVGGEDYTSRIPLRCEPTDVEVYPWGDVRFENIELLSVALRADFPWAHEAFVVAYWADPVPDLDDEDDQRFIEEKVHILTQYVPPRGVTDDDVLPEVVGHGDEETFAARMIRNFTHASTPNPWAKYSVMVLYENAELADRVLTHDELHMPENRYHRTPPEELHLE